MINFGQKTIKKIYFSCTKLFFFEANYMQLMHLTLMRTKNYLGMLANTDKHTNHYLMHNASGAKCKKNKQKRQTCEEG